MGFLRATPAPTKTHEREIADDGEREGSEHRVDLLPPARDRDQKLDSAEIAKKNATDGQSPPIIAPLQPSRRKCP